jgi:hypothetical protein
MSTHHLTDCSEALLDLICYERLRYTLCPETEAMFADHLAKCPTCRQKVQDYIQLIKPAAGGLEPDGSGNKCLVH